MTDKIKISKLVILAVIIILVIAACSGVWYFAARETALPASTEPTQVNGQEIQQAEDFRYTEPQLREKVEKTAKEQFGDDAFIIFLSSEGPSVLEIHGTKRNIYIYAVDSRSEYEKTGEIRGLYHADANTGEIFDNGKGSMEKISTGE